MCTMNNWDETVLENLEFDEERWENLIGSDEICTEQIPQSISNVNSNRNIHRIVKLSTGSFTKSAFVNSNTFIQTDKKMTLVIAPCSKQRVRYENECEKILRFISVPNRNTLTIKIPNLFDIFAPDNQFWLRITRSTIDHRQDGLIFHHPYPLWMKNQNAKIHQGSIFIQITNADLINGLIRIETLAMIRLKQDQLSKINTLSIFSSKQLDFADQHLLEVKTPKRIRDEYKLRQSVLNFQIVCIDQDNIVYATDCICQTEPIHEMEANGS